MKVITNLWHLLKFIQTPAALMLAGRATQLFSQAVMVLVIPKVLAPVLYVQLNLVLPLAALGVSLIFGWMINSIYRHVFELLGPNGERFRQTVFFYYISVTFLLCLIAFFVQFFTLSVYRLIPLLLAAAALKNGLVSILNSSGNNKGFFLSNVGFAFSLLIFIGLCYVDSGNNLQRNLMVYAIIDMIIALTSWAMIGVFRIPPVPRFYKDIAIDYSRYGFPLVAKMMGVWIISISDRYLLSIWETSENVASYILSYQLAGSSITIPMSFLIAVIIPKILLIEKEKNQHEALNYIYKILRIYLRLMLPVFIIFSIIVLLFQYYVYPNYEFNPLTIVLLVFAHLISELAHFYNKEFELNGRTLIITKAVGVGAIVNVLLNLILIPFFGGLGAAIATLLAYMITIYIVFSMRKYRP